MKIGIDASRALIKQRTGIEEYAYQTIKHLRGELKEHKVILYTHRWGRKELDFDLPDNWQIKEIGLTRLWTQLGLSLEMLLRPVDVLFIPAHTVPLIHPKNTIVTIHGLEYEHTPRSYSFYSRCFHKFFVRKSCQWASKVIAVSQNTKKDIVKFYRTPKEKIKVIYNGYQKAGIKLADYRETQNFKYLLFIGRLEIRKNIIGIAKAFDILRKKYNYRGKLILAGKPGYGHQKISACISNLDCRHYIVEPGFISVKKKYVLLKEADIFMFPSFSEGFGIPILEAQGVGTPVITSARGPMNEVAGNDEILIDPTKPEEMAKLANKVILQQNFRKRIIERGKENIKKFSWDKCGQEVAETILSL